VQPIEASDPHNLSAVLVDQNSNKKTIAHMNYLIKKNQLQSVPESPVD
jgi:hypothetical protein